MKLITIMLVVVGVVLTGTGLAAGSTFTFQPSIGIWNNSLNWKNEFGQNGIPTTGDTAIIGNRCTMESGTTEACKIIDIQSAGTLQIEDDATLNLGDASTSTTSTLNGNILFIKSGGTCSCDPDSPPTAGTFNIIGNVTLDGSGTVSAGCDDDFSPCRNPAEFSGDMNTTLTLDPGTSQMTFNEYILFSVPLDIDSNVFFSVIEVKQVMQFDAQVEGPGTFQIAQGKVEVNACMVLTGADGRFDLPFHVDFTDMPELVINAQTCTEGVFAIDNGTLTANENFRARDSGFHLGSQCVTQAGGGSCASNGPSIIIVAANKEVVLDGTDGTCTACP